MTTRATIYTYPDPDQDDCLAHAADKAAEELGLEGYDLVAGWADEDRNNIWLAIPRHALDEALDLGYWTFDTLASASRIRPAAHGCFRTDEDDDEDDD